MEVKVSHLGQVKFSIQSRSNTVFCDQPQENGGEDTAMTPPELMLASLGSCAAFYAVQYLKTRHLAESLRNRWLIPPSVSPFLTV